MKKSKMAQKAESREPNKKPEDIKQLVTNSEVQISKFKKQPQAELKKLAAYEKGVSTF